MFGLAAIATSARTDGQTNRQTDIVQILRDLHTSITPGCLHCFDTVDCALRKAFHMQKNHAPAVPKSFRTDL